MRWVLLTSILCITGIEIVALIKGHNGLLLTSTIGIIAGMGGYAIPHIKKIKN